MGKSTKKAKPAKPSRDFPLFPQRSGRWAKRIRGRFVYFGVWSDPDAALRRWLHERDYLLAGAEGPHLLMTTRRRCGTWATHLWLPSVGGSRPEKSPSDPGRTTSAPATGCGRARHASRCWPVAGGGAKQS